MAAPGVEAHSTPHGRNQLGAESLLRAHVLLIRLVQTAVTVMTFSCFFRGHGLETDHDHCHDGGDGVGNGTIGG